MNEISSESVLARITTHWSQVQNPVQFIARYAPAIQRYFRALIRHPHEAEDASQDFLTRITSRGFQDITVNRGRFRDYLAVAVKNSAMNHLKRLGRSRTSDFPADALTELDGIIEEADREWMLQWHQCILDMAWRRLHHHERQNPGNLCHTVLKARAEHEAHTDAEVARAIAQSTGHSLSPDAFRKQLSRARRLFGEMIVEEVARTLEDPTPERVEDELIATGLMSYLRPFLKDDWRKNGLLSDADAKTVNE